MLNIYLIIIYPIEIKILSLYQREEYLEEAQSFILHSENVIITLKSVS